MSSNFVKDLADMHAKFGVNKRVKELMVEDPKALLEFIQFRINFLQEELNETQKLGLDRLDPEELLDGLVDICVVAIGTADAFDMNFQEAWDRVHAANMQKVPGIKPTRPNKHGFPDLIKPEGWVGPNHNGLYGMLPDLISKVIE